MIQSSLEPDFVSPGVSSNKKRERKCVSVKTKMESRVSNYNILEFWVVGFPKGTLVVAQHHIPTP